MNVGSLGHDQPSAERHDRSSPAGLIPSRRLGVHLDDVDQLFNGDRSCTLGRWRIRHREGTAGSGRRNDLRASLGRHVKATTAEAATTAKSTAATPESGSALL